jgi:hypothetical protein
LVSFQSTEIPKEIKVKMASWDAGTHYLSDCLSSLGPENTALLLQAILENRNLRISSHPDSSEQDELVAKLAQLWEAFNIAKIVGKPCDGLKENKADDNNKGPALVVEPGGVVGFFGFDRTPSKFAGEWARVLHQHLHDNVKLKDDFDAYNGKVNKFRDPKSV